MKGMYGVFKKPIYCPNASWLGYCTRLVEIGDIIEFRYPSDTGAGRLARVVGVAKRDGMGKKYKPRTVLAVLEADFTLHTAFLRHVKVEWVLTACKPPTVFHRVFFESTLPHPDVLAAVEKHGSFCDNYIADYLDADGNLRTDWRKAWEAKLHGDRAKKGTT